MKEALSSGMDSLFNRTFKSLIFGLFFDPRVDLSFLSGFGSNGSVRWKSTDKKAIFTWWNPDKKEKLKHRSKNTTKIKLLKIWKSLIRPHSQALPDGRLDSTWSRKIQTTIIGKMHPTLVPPLRIPNISDLSDALFTLKYSRYLKCEVGAIEVNNIWYAMNTYFLKYLFSCDKKDFSIWSSDLLSKNSSRNKNSSSLSTWKYYWCPRYQTSWYFGCYAALIHCTGTHKYLLTGGVINRLNSEKFQIFYFWA